jgi:hypothetical protein
MFLYPLDEHLYVDFWGIIKVDVEVEHERIVIYRHELHEAWLQ